MIHELQDTPGELTPTELTQRYEAALSAIIEAHGPETVTERTGIDRERIDAVGSGSGSVLLSEAAAVCALDEEMADAGVIETEARDALLLGMTMAVLDVDTLSGEINDQIEPRAIQQKIEGRTPMTLDEFALLYSTIEARKT